MIASKATAFTMTQEFLSAMLGVRRPGVTLAVGALQRAGLVQHERGAMRVLDRPRLEAVACECYEAVQRRFAWLMDAEGSIRNSAAHRPVSDRRAG